MSHPLSGLAHLFPPSRPRLFRFELSAQAGPARQLHPQRSRPLADAFQLVTGKLEREVVSRVAGVLEDESAKVLGPKGGEVQVREQEVGQGDEARGWCRGIPNL